MNNQSTHPYKPYIPEGATKLIIGTIPPARFCVQQGLYDDDVNFYYGSKDNGFWELVSTSTHIKLDYKNTQKAVEERKSLLAALHMGITDMIESCVRQDNKSDDSSLSEMRYKDLAALLNDYPKIDTLIYTSKYVVSLINCFSDKHYHEGWDQKGQNGFVEINKKSYSVIVLYSPSPNALRGVDKKTRQAQYAEVFKLE